MDTRKLGSADLQITPVGFGAWATGGGNWEYSWGPQDDNDSIAAIHKALELGINWIDTAAVYGLGHSEEVVARALKRMARSASLHLHEMRPAMGLRAQSLFESFRGFHPPGMRRQSAPSSNRSDRSLSDPLAAH